MKKITTPTPIRGGDWAYDSEADKLTDKTKHSAKEADPNVKTTTPFEDSAKTAREASKAEAERAVEAQHTLAKEKRQHAKVIADREAEQARRTTVKSERTASSKTSSSTATKGGHKKSEPTPETGPADTSGAAREGRTTVSSSAKDPSIR
jgi:hypothetical protein